MLYTTMFELFQRVYVSKLFLYGNGNSYNWLNTMKYFAYIII